MSRGAVHNAMPASPIADAVSRMVGDTTGALGLERYGETLTPILNPWELPEWDYLRRTRICMGYAQAGPVAGEYSTISLLNPITSQHLIVLEHAFGLLGTAGSVFTMFPIDYTAIVGAATITNNSVDSRWGGANYPLGLVYQGTTAAAPAGRALVQMAWLPTGGTEQTIVSPVVIGPGTCVAFCAATVNIMLRLNLVWRERRALSGELE